MRESPKAVSRISGIVHRGGAAPVIRALADHGIVEGHLAAGRAAVLQEKKRFLGAGEKIVLAEDPIEIFSFLVDPASEEAALKLVLKVAGMEIRGRGMAFGETVQLLGGHELCAENRPEPFTAECGIRLIPDLVGICCIVQRGQGDEVARVSLDTGTCVPAITFGRGTGVRDKLGLLRITIPAEKEVIHIVTDRHSADAVMGMMIDVGRLDEPGKGFIYAYPLGRGIVNTKIQRGMARHAASIEQIIAVVDEIKGGTTWRRRSGTAVSGNGGESYLLDLIDLTLVCDEGRGEDLVKAAMEVGAAGATISHQKHIRPQDSPFSRVSPARECCNMIVSRPQVPAIGEALERAGAFDDRAHGQLYGRPVPKAFTYLGKA
jgi:hypothetical protein